jgi:putative endonuclease
MATDHLERGRLGEEIAAGHLTRAGLDVIDRNWRCRLGEIDIIAVDGDALVMCEVKTRTSEDFGTPLAAVTPRKLRRLRLLAGEWLREHDCHPRQVRIDVIGILLPPRGNPSIEHLRDVA